MCFIILSISKAFFKSNFFSNDFSHLHAFRANVHILSIVYPETRYTRRAQIEYRCDLDRIFAHSDGRNLFVYTQNYGTSKRTAVDRIFFFNPLQLHLSKAVLCNSGAKKFILENAIIPKTPMQSKPPAAIYSNRSTYR